MFKYVIRSGNGEDITRYYKALELNEVWLFSIRQATTFDNISDAQKIIDKLSYNPSWYIPNLDFTSLEIYPMIGNAFNEF